MARELQEKRIRINAIAPGLTRVEAWNTFPPSVINCMENGRALSNAQRLEDVTGSVVWLLERSFALYPPGQLILVNGGFVFNQ